MTPAVIAVLAVGAILAAAGGVLLALDLRSMRSRRR